ncbi:hypothetical protein [Aestuariivivens insulae]|uniref:hypothetical protein n=1 Tax=Aestuariivivens insulae TaxID=1621988 RepID=UPI001F58B8E1|nr:hypothetical protein [Aestuariivivens insulae]
MKKKLILMLLIAGFTSCKSDKKSEMQSSKDEINLDSSSKFNKKAENEIHNSLIVTIDAIVTKDDTFHLMYLSDNITSWSSKGLIKTKVKGDEVAQKIQFKFPQGVFPTKFRIDLGFNEEQKSIDLYKMTFQFEGKEVIVEEHLIEKYFTPNIYAKYVEGNMADLRFQEINNKYNPLIITTDYFINKLETKLYL